MADDVPADNDTMAVDMLRVLTETLDRSRVGRDQTPVEVLRARIAGAAASSSIPEQRPPGS